MGGIFSKDKKSGSRITEQDQAVLVRFLSYPFVLSFLDHILLHLSTFQQVISLTRKENQSRFRLKRISVKISRQIVEGQYSLLQFDEFFINIFARIQIVEF